ncbi:MAG: hypothetical protein ABI297_08340, partial [Ginsengibacter sp.]
MTPRKNKKNIKKQTRSFDGILPFTEKPSNIYLNEDEDTQFDEFPASELFSLFTADIIKEEVTF